jgi:hypothetical protein
MAEWRELIPVLTTRQVELLKSDGAAGCFTPDALLFLARDLAQQALWLRSN